MSDFDIERFKEGLNNLMMQCAPGQLTLRQCEKLMLDFIAAIESTGAPEQTP